MFCVFNVNHILLLLLSFYQLSKEHRVVLLESMGKIVLNRCDKIQADLAKELLKLAFKEMTKSKVRLFLAFLINFSGGNKQFE